MSTPDESILSTNVPRAVRAWAADRKVWVALEDGREIGFPSERFPRLRNAPNDLLARIRARGRALRWEELDEDISIGGILAGRFGPAS